MTVSFCQEVYDQMRVHYEIPQKIKITTPADILQIKKVSWLSKQMQENFCVIAINGASEVIRMHTITKGLLNHSLVHPREVYHPLISDRAAAYIAVHNHPSGNIQPSDQDIQITKQLAQSGDLMGIKLIDHIIVSTSGILSLREMGYL
jgi:DNA repair protein RadC